LSDPVNTARQVLFVGGPGRSGTSFIADRLGRHPQICSFPNSELKLFTEKNGLIDLHHALVESYSPNRATVALDQFRKFYIALVDGRFGQEALTAHAPRPEWIAILDTFVATLTKHGQAGLATSAAFHRSARMLLWRIADLAAGAKPATEAPGIFLEKTPHALLAPNFLTNLAPGCRLLHVMRDPRSIAFSLKSMSWGPETLSECSAWVANYCEAWLHAQTQAAASGHEITCVHIEDVAVAPEEASRQICGVLKLEPVESLFLNADIKTLNGWRGRCSESDFSTLNAGLRGWCRHFGYALGEVGTLSRHDTQSRKHEDHAA
jgi:hypothetical protein